MRSFWTGFWLFLTTMVALAFVMRPDTVDGVLLYVGWLGAGVVFAVLGLIYMLPVCSLVAFGAWLYFFVKTKHTNLMRPYNGSYALQKLNPNKPHVFYDPNQQVNAAVAWIPDGQGGGQFVEFSGGVPPEHQLAVAQMRARVANTQAAMPSDDAIVQTARQMKHAMGGSSFLKNMRPGAAEQRALDAVPKGWAEEPARAKMPAQPVPAAQVPEQQVYVPTLRDAVTQAQPFVWPIGYSTQTQKLAAFRMLNHIHGGVVGSPGTGKTTGVGFLLVSHALRQGVHTVVVDGDGGASWNALAPWTEHIIADDKMLPDILNTLENEMERRGRVLASINAQTWEQTNGVIRPMLVVVEEFGDMRSRIGAANKQAGVQLDDKMDRLMRRARKVGIAMIIIDQYPDQWSTQMVAAAKCMCVFQLGPNQGNKVGEYEAQNLPDTGVFLLRGVKYNTWPVHGKVQKLLAEVPALSVSARVIDRGGSVRAGRNSGEGEGVTSVTPPANSGANTTTVTPANSAEHDYGEWRDVDGDDAGTGAVEGNQAQTSMPAGAPTTTAGWYEWVLTNYFTSHIELLQTDENGNGVGVMDLARAMAFERDGHIDNVDDLKGHASKVAKRIRNEARLGEDKSWTE